MVGEATRTSVSPWRALVVLACLFGAFWIGDVLAQYVIYIAPSLVGLASSTAGAQGAAASASIVTFALERLSQAPLGVSLERGPLVCGACSSLMLGVSIMARRSSREKPDVHGSERFATLEERSVYAHTTGEARLGPLTLPWPKPDYCERLEDDNIIVSAHTKVSLSDFPFFKKKIPNKHVYMIAASGSGKTYSFVQTNAMQLNASMFFSDPKGENFTLLALFLERAGYVVRYLDLRGGETMRWNLYHYNPMHYVSNMTDIAQLADMIVQNTTSPDSHENDQFFTSMEKIVYTCLLGFFFYFFAQRGREEDCNLPTMLDYLALTKSAGDGITGLDLVFYGTRAHDGIMGFREWLVDVECGGDEAAARRRPEWAILTNYDGFVSSSNSPETMASIVASCYARLRDFATADVRSLLLTDDLELRDFGKRKSAFFAIIPDGGAGTFSFISSMALHQLFHVNMQIADNSPGGHLDVPVMCYLDELANIGKLPELETLFPTLRSRGINLCAIVQDTGQLKNNYGDAARQIYSNSAITLYYGGGDFETCKQLSEEIGNTTVWLTESSTSRSSTGTSVSTSEHAYQVPLMSAERMYNGGMETGECLTHYRNDRWFLDETPDPTRHPRWEARQRAQRDLVGYSAEHGCSSIVEAWTRMHEPEAGQEPTPVPQGKQPATEIAEVAVQAFVSRVATTREEESP